MSEQSANEIRKDEATAAERLTLAARVAEVQEARRDRLAERKAKDKRRAKKSKNEATAKKEKDGAKKSEDEATAVSQEGDEVFAESDAKKSENEATGDLLPLPVLGEKAGVRVLSSSSQDVPEPKTGGPSPQPSPRSTGAREAA